MSFPEILIPTLFLASFAGMTYIVLKALGTGAEAYATEYMTDASRQFEDMFLFIPPHRISQIAWGSSAVCFTLFFLITGNLTTVLGIVKGTVFGSITALAALFAPSWLLKLLRAHRLRRFNEQLVDSLVSMSNALKAGFSITQAFESIVKEGLNPISQEFSVLLQQTRVGVRFEEALVNLEKRVGSDDLTLMIRSIEIARITGGNLTEVFERLAETIRERMRIEGRVRSLTAQGRLQGLVVGFMPVLLGVAMFLVYPDVMRKFFSEPIALLVVGLVLLLELVGALLIRKIIRIDV